jgi:aminotransferase in exopolysaccharide biosynthesis
MYKEFIDFVRSLYNTTDFIPLHAPTFKSRDREYVLDAINSTFVSSVGEYVNRFERDLAGLTGAARAVATVNGTTALQTALRLVGVKCNDEVITQPLTFVATANAISHLGATPVFVDVDRDTMGLSPDAFNLFLHEKAIHKNNGSFNKQTGKRFAAIVPMHTFGHPCRIEKIVAIAREWNIPVVEDAAEAIGSWSGNKHCGTFGDVGILSFNGNKTITCGGGGAILTNSEQLANRAKHLTTTAKLPHPWEFDHDEVGYNYRMPNLNAALACAQLERLPDIIREKREIANAYKDFFTSRNWGQFMIEPQNANSNYWLCTIALDKPFDRNTFLEETNNANVMTRPAWKLMVELSIYIDCQSGPLMNALWLRERLVNLPSGILKT